MNMTELKKLLELGEWNDAEFKEARANVPKNAFETVSAFANTHGGWLILGVAQSDEGFDITGVEKPDKVQNDFMSVLHADGKINHDVQITEKNCVSATRLCSRFTSRRICVRASLCIWMGISDEPFCAKAAVITTPGWGT